MDWPELSAAEQALLATAYEGFCQATAWPVFSWVDIRLDQGHGLDAEDVISSMPPGIAGRDRSAGQRGALWVTAAGLATVPAAQGDCAYFVRIVRWLAERERSHDPGSPAEPSGLEIGLEDTVPEAWEEMPPNETVDRVLLLLQSEGLTTVHTGAGQVVIEVDRRIRPYRDVADINDYVRRRPPPVSSSSILFNTMPTTWLSPLGVTNTYLPFTDAGKSEPSVTGIYLFILMPFTPDWSANVRDLIDQACERLQEEYEDLRWERADDMTTSGRITDQIITAIERADLVIADVTDSNPNVMFELGYAAALGRPIVILNQSVAASPFDIKDWRQIVYSMDKLAEARNELIRHLDANLRRVRERAGT